MRTQLDASSWRVWKRACSAKSNVHTNTLMVHKLKAKLVCVVYPAFAEKVWGVSEIQVDTLTTHVHVMITGAVFLLVCSW